MSGMFRSIEETGSLDTLTPSARLFLGVCLVKRCQFKDARKVLRGLKSRPCIYLLAVANMAELDATDRPLYHRRFLDVVKCANDHPGMQYLVALWNLRADRCRVAQQGLLDLLSTAECEVPAPLLQAGLALAYHREQQSDDAVRTIESAAVQGSCAAEVLVAKAIIYQDAQQEVAPAARTAVELARSGFSLRSIAVGRL